MAETFSGEWTVEVLEMVATHSGFRFIVEGALAGNGVYAGEMGTPPVAVSGDHWSIRFEWEDRTGIIQPVTNVARTAAYTLDLGLLVFLGTNGLLILGAQDFGDITLRCRNVDPPINPWIPFTNRYSFIVPRRPGGPPG